MKPLVVIKNPDKLMAHLDRKEPTLMPSHPSRIIIAGRSGCSKTTCTLNIVGRASPPFDRIVCWHGDHEGSHEYDICDPEMVGEMPALDSWDPTIKNCLIIEELNVLAFTKQQRGDLERIFNYQSSHKSLTVICAVQNFTNLSPSIRRSACWWVLYPSISLDAVSDISRKTGHDLRQLMRLCNTKYDSITFDFSGNGPRLRLNMFDPIDDDEEEEMG